MKTYLINKAVDDTLDHKLLFGQLLFGFDLILNFI